MSRSSSNYLPTLDGWRAVAISMVVLGHAVHLRYCAAEPPSLGCRFLLLGGYGVALFFGLSGFLITTRLLQEYDAHGRISLRNFYVRRVFRILPAATVMVGTVALLGALGAIPVAASEVWSSLFFFRNYVPLFLDHHAGVYTGQYWSLAVEEHFYLLWPVLLIALLRSRRTITLVLLIALALAAWRRLDGHFRWIEQLTNVPSYQFYFRTDTRLDALLYGCVLALGLRDERWAGWIRKLSTPVVWYTLLLLFLVGIGTQARGILWLSILCPALIVGTMLRPEATVSRLLENPALRWLGRISYSLYLWHVLTMPQDAQVIRVPALQSWPQNVPLAIGIAAVCYYCLEKPLIRVGHRLTHTPLPVARETADQRGVSQQRNTSATLHA